MYHSKITGLGYYVPDNVVTNDDLSKIMDTNDEWIQERTGIQERRHIIRGEDTTTSMGVKAAQIAIERSGVAKEDIDFVIFATLSPDYYFPGPGVLVQRDLGLRTVGALDVRNQCSGFVYAASVMGVTGARSGGLSNGASDLVSRAKAVTATPVSVGLGVSTRAQAKEVASFADGVIVGSAFINALTNNKDLESGLSAVRSLVKELALGVREGR